MMVMMKYCYTTFTIFDTDLIIIFTQGFRHWTMKIRLLCWKGLQLKLCFSVQLRFSVRNFQLDMLTYWKREFERAVSNLANGKKSIPASKNLYIPWRQASCLSYAVICPLWLAMALKMTLSYAVIWPLWLA